MKKQKDLFHTYHSNKQQTCFIYNKFSFRIFYTWPLWQVCEMIDVYDFIYLFFLLTLVVNHLVLQGLCLFGVLIWKATSL
jgi:hypothetical protein